MADYVKVNFTDEVPATTPVKYKISQDSDGDIATDATIELVTSVTPGTAMNATNFNHMETGIFNAQAAADDAQADATQAIADAATAQAAADAAQAAADAAQADADTAIAGLASVLGYTYNNASDVHIDSTDETILTTTVSVPRAGTIVAIASGRGWINGGSTVSVTISIKIDSEDAKDIGVSQIIQHVDQVGSGNNFQQNISTFHKKTVTSGSHTIVLHGTTGGSTPDAYANCNLMILLI